MLESFLGAAKSFRIEQSEEFIELNELLFEISCHNLPPLESVQRGSGGTSILSPVCPIAINSHP